MNGDKTDKMENEIFVLIKFTKTSGKIGTVLESFEVDKLKTWATRNTPKTKDCIIFSKTSGSVEYYIRGREDGLPEVLDLDLGHIDEYCPGLLQAIWDQSG